MLARLWLPLLGVAPFALAQNADLPAHEVLNYSIEWRLITAGKVRLEWQQARASSQVNLKVESIGLVSKLFHVEDSYQANLNQDGCAESTLLYSQEGNRQRETRVTFDESQGQLSGARPRQERGAAGQRHRNPSLRARRGRRLVFICAP